MECYATVIQRRMDFSLSKWRHKGARKLQYRPYLKEIENFKLKLNSALQVPEVTTYKENLTLKTNKKSHFNIFSTFVSLIIPRN